MPSLLRWRGASFFSTALMKNFDADVHEYSLCSEIGFRSEVWLVLLKCTSFNLKYIVVCKVFFAKSTTVNVPLNSNHVPVGWLSTMPHELRLTLVWHQFASSRFYRYAPIEYFAKLNVAPGKMWLRTSFDNCTDNVFPIYCTDFQHRNFLDGGFWILQHPLKLFGRVEFFDQSHFCAIHKNFPETVWNNRTLMRGWRGYHFGGRGMDSRIPSRALHLVGGHHRPAMSSGCRWNAQPVSCFWNFDAVNDVWLGLELVDTNCFWGSRNRIGFKFSEKLCFLFNFFSLLKATPFWVEL